MAVKIVLQGSLGLMNQSCRSALWLVQLYLNHSMLGSLRTEDTA